MLDGLKAGGGGGGGAGNVFGLDAFFCDGISPSPIGATTLIEHAA
jgi:hypothetical protein